MLWSFSRMIHHEEKGSPMYLHETESYPLLMRCIHQAEDLCESASHAAYHLRRHPSEAELNSVESATSQAGFHLRRCGKMLETTYNESNWFDTPSKPGTARRSVALLRCMVKDLERAVRKIQKAASYLADYDDCRAELLELRRAKACLAGCLLALRQCYRVYCSDIAMEARQKATGKRLPAALVGKKVSQMRPRAENCRAVYGT